MYRDGIRVKDVNGNQFDVPLGVFTAALPIAKYNPATGLIEGAAAGGGIATGLRETSGPTDLAMGAVVDNGFLIRSGTNIVGVLKGVFNPGGSQSLFTGSFAVGDVAEWGGTQWNPKQRSYGSNSASQVLAVTTLADVTGHTFNIFRSGTFLFRFKGAYRTNATTTALRFSANFTGSSSSYNGGLNVVTGAAGAEVYTAQIALNTAMGAGAGPGAVDQEFDFWGRIVTTSAGTFAFRIASSVAVAAGVTLAAGAVSDLIQQ